LYAEDKPMKLNNSQSVSIIIPLHNEEVFLWSQITGLIKQLGKMHIKNYEILLVENGSVDKTLSIARKLKKENSKIRVFSLPYPNYGQAIKYGIKSAKNDLVIQLDLDWIDGAFMKEAMQKFASYDILVGSKFLGKVDKRSIARKLLSNILRFAIRILFGYAGSDTHGIKAYNRIVSSSIIGDIPQSIHLFDTLILIRAKELGFRIKEVPADIKELRPSRFPSFLRMFQVVFEIGKLVSIKVQGWNNKNYQLAVSNKI
jgi:glycosyltransferase involved in cell wall biosynthesis